MTRVWPSDVTVKVRPYGAPQGMEQELRGYVVDYSDARGTVIVALRGQDGEVYREFNDEQVKEIRR